MAVVPPINDCENGYSLLVIRFNVHFVNYDPPVIGIFANFSNLFNPDEVLVTVYDASTGRRQPPRVAMDVDVNNASATTNENNDGDSYYQRSLTLQEAFDTPDDGLRTCIPDDVCLMVGISYILPEDYSVTLYNKNGTVNSDNVMSVPSSYPFLIGGNSLTFTQVGDTCQSESCSSPNQSLLEFDFWTGEIHTSPFWRVYETRADYSGDINHNHHHDDIVVEGCGYDCNYPEHRLIRKKMCLDRSRIISASNTTSTNTTLENNYDDGSNYTSSPSPSPSPSSSSICYNFFLAAAHHWDPASPMSSAFRLIYDGITLRDEISFQFVSVPLGTGDNDICVQSFQCQNNDSINNGDQVLFEFFLYRPYSERSLHWELRDRSRASVMNYEDDDDNNNSNNGYLLLGGTLPPTHVYNISTGEVLNANDTNYAYFSSKEEWMKGPEGSISANFPDEFAEFDNFLVHSKQQEDYNYDTKSSVNTLEIQKAVPVHVRKCIPIERSKCLEFKIFLDDEAEADDDDDVEKNETSGGTTTIPFEADPYQLRLDGVTYRHSYYWLGDGDTDCGYHPHTGAIWHPQSETTLMGRSCNVAVNRSADDSYNNLVDNLNFTTGSNATMTNRINNNIDIDINIISNSSSVCNPLTESLFQLDFHTVKGNASGVADHSNIFFFNLVGGLWMTSIWDNDYYVRDQGYFGNNLLFDEAYSVVQCVPKKECLGFEVSHDDGDGFPVINSTYSVSRNGVLLTDVDKRDFVWVTPYGCDASFNAVNDESSGFASAFHQSFNNDANNAANFLLLITFVFLVLS